MKSVTLLLIIAILAVGCSSVFIRQDTDEWTPKLTAKTAEAIVSASPCVASNMTAYAASSRSDIAGHYENGCGLCGYDLHLFSDGTYFFAFWADISPMRIQESGHWCLERDFILLSMEKNYGPGYDLAPWREDRKYFLFTKGPNLYLMGNHFWYSLFMEHHKDDANFGWCSFKRETKYDRSNDAKAKEQLIEASWKPWLTDEERKKSNHSLEPTR